MEVTSTKIKTILIEDKPFGKGGEGKIHRIKSPLILCNHCIKIFHDDMKTVDREEKIKYMISNPPSKITDTAFFLCWPEDIIYSNSRFLGFMMRFAGSSISLKQLTNPNGTLELSPVWQKFDLSLSKGINSRLQLSLNIAIAIHNLHQKGYVLVDLKPANVLVTHRGKLYIVDMDSIHIVNKSVVFEGKVCTDEYTPPELQNNTLTNKDKTINLDLFSLAVILYELLIGIHPFIATFDGKFSIHRSMSDKIANELFVYGKYKDHIRVLPPQHNTYNRIDKSIQLLFIKAFTKKDNRPTAEEWGKNIYQLLNPTTQLSNKPSSTKPKLVLNIPIIQQKLKLKLKVLYKNKITKLVLFFVALLILFFALKQPITKLFGSKIDVAIVKVPIKIEKIGENFFKVHIDWKANQSVFKAKIDGEIVRNIMFEEIETKIDTIDREIAVKIIGEWVDVNGQTHTVIVYQDFTPYETDGFKNFVFTGFDILDRK